MKNNMFLLKIYLNIENSGTRRKAQTPPLRNSVLYNYRQENFKLHFEHTFVGRTDGKGCNYTRKLNFLPDVVQIIIILTTRL